MDTCYCHIKDYEKYRMSYDFEYSIPVIWEEFQLLIPIPKDYCLSRVRKYQECANINLFFQQIGVKEHI